MTVFAIILVLILNLISPKFLDNATPHLTLWWRRNVTRLAKQCENTFRSGGHFQGVLAWGFMMFICLLPCVIFYTIAHYLHNFIGFIATVILLSLVLNLYSCLEHLNKIHHALSHNQLDQTRQALTQWTGKSCEHMNESALIRLAGERGLLESYRDVFMIIFWSSVCSPIFGILCAVAAILARTWHYDHEQPATFGYAAHYIYTALSWPVALIMSGLFALVGQFESTLLALRGAQKSPEFWVLNAASGALTPQDDRPFILRRITGLIWRALILLMLILLLFTF